MTSRRPKKKRTAAAGSAAESITSTTASPGRTPCRTNQLWYGLTTRARTPATASGRKTPENLLRKRLAP
jgi:hypothetical protein